MIISLAFLMTIPACSKKRLDASSNNLFNVGYLKQLPLVAAQWLLRPHRGALTILAQNHFKTHGTMSPYQGGTICKRNKMMPSRMIIYEGKQNDDYYQTLSDHILNKMHRNITGTYRSYSLCGNHAKYADSFVPVRLTESRTPLEARRR